MAAIASLKSSKVALKLNAGTRTSGTAITKTDTLPAMVKSVSADDIIALKTAAAPILNYPISSVEHTVVEVIEEG